MLKLQRSVRSGAGFIAAVFLSGVCSVAPAQQQHARPSVPIVNYEDRPISTPGGQPLPAATIRELFVAAGKRYPDRQWAFTDAGPDKLIGTHSFRRHTIEVEITYSQERYSIRYRSSTNMNYELLEPQEGALAVVPAYSTGAGGRNVNVNEARNVPAIHPEYNRRVKRLVDDFENELRKR